MKKKFNTEIFFHLFDILIVKAETYQIDTNTEPSESKYSSFFKDIIRQI